MKPRVAIVLMKKRFHFFYQLQNLLGEYIDFSTYSLEEGISSYINCDLALTPSNEAVAYIKKYLMPSTEVLVVRRTISKIAYEAIQTIPANEKVLVVSTYMEMSLQIIAVLYELGFYQFDFIPYDEKLAGTSSYEDISYAITPDEKLMVPSSVEHIIDIGIRLVDISTLFDILNKLNLVNEETRKILVEHMQEMVPLSMGFVKMFTHFAGVDGQLESLMNMMNCGCITFDRNNRIQSYNATAIKIFATDFRLEADLPLERLFGTFITKHNLYASTVTNVCVRMGHCFYWLSKKPLFEKGVCIGGLLTIRLEDNPSNENNYVIRNHRGYQAKHVFADILGKHPLLLQAIDFAKKAARTEFDILIEGESGVGKELFAQAIHNLSLRSKKPFVAFNCAALNDTLLESELFGYEEGAFTGANKKGRQGLFEMADQGTIFLDEIAEISKATQIKLLRVLQERELIRVGGNRIIPLNIRVIAATNQNLYEAVQRGNFRMDLYFRLNVINIRVPPLRKRKEDIPLLIGHILQKHQMRKDIPADLMKGFLRYDWPGNVRELRNCLQYMISMYADLSVKIMPPYLMDRLHENIHEISVGADENIEEKYMILKILKNACRRKVYIGRKGILNALKQNGLLISEPRIRVILEKMVNDGWVVIFKGRAGTRITAKGLHLIEEK